MRMPCGQPKSSGSPVEVDFLKLCQNIVRRIADLVNGGNLLNRRQCSDLLDKLCKTTKNVKELVLHCGASPVLDFRPALENLYLNLEKAKVLVSKCGEEDWCAAAVFQSHNENAFRVILLAVGLCYNAIFEQAKSCTSEGRNFQVEDLRDTFMFLPAPPSAVQLDNQDLEERLGDLASGYTSVKLLHYFLTRKVVLQQCLARYMLVKLKFTSKQLQAAALDEGCEILWQKDTEPPGTWGSSYYLGAGANDGGVCSTKWLGIPCAKKVFHVKECESLFLKEAGILAHLKHPCIINFICCSNGEEKGDRFIAMELMEKSLSQVIEDQKKVHFPLAVVVDVFVQIARGMWYLHEQGVAHRDLKPQNVVVNRLLFPHLLGNFSVKLVDFGMSKTKVRLSKSNSISMRGVGTTMYRAPEVHPKAHPAGKGKATWFKADVFSFEMTCAHLLSLKSPFADMEQLSELYKELMNGKRPELPGEYPEELVALVRDCWDTSPSMRPSFLKICTRLEILRHKMLRGFSDPHQGLLTERIEDTTGFGFIKMKMEEHEPFLSRSSIDNRDGTVEVPLEIQEHEPSVSGPSFVTSDEGETYDSDKISRNDVERDPRALKLANWESTYKESRERIDQLTVSSHKVKKEIHYLIGFFVVLQVAVFIIALLHPSSLTCHPWWGLFGVWLLCSIITLFGLCYKFYNMSKWKRATVEEFHCSKILMSHLHSIKRHDERFDSSERDQLEDDEKKKKRSLISNRFFVPAWLAVLFILFAGSLAIILIYRQKFYCDCGDRIASISSPTAPTRAPTSSPPAPTASPPAPTASPPAPTASATPGWSSFLTQAVFDGNFPDRVAYYDYEPFQIAAGAYSTFGTSGTKEDQKRELAAFLGNVKQESGGLQFVEATDKLDSYCDMSDTQYPCAPGQKYYGRGPIQLTWNYNYGACGAALNISLLANPDQVAQNSVVAYQTALWFWMTQGPHDAILKQSFSDTIRIIYGGLECNQTVGSFGNYQMENRVTYYKNLCQALGVNPGTDLDC